MNELNHPISYLGFTLLRNGNKYDYCFRESLLSLSALTSQTFLALGDSDDGTEDDLKGIPGLQLFHTLWDESLKSGAVILSQQTNLALERARKFVKTHNVKNAWGIYLQADEVFHQDDYQKIKDDIAKAHSMGRDAVSFRYFHFWQNHHQIAINKKWYPQEIRAIRLDSEIESWGDAQSFRHCHHVYESDAVVYHYGHVRLEEQYKNKKRDILKLYHEDAKLKKYQKREKRFDQKTEVLPFWGSHPELMKERILRLGDLWDLPQRDEIHVVGDKTLFTSSFLSQIKAKSISWYEHFSQVPRGQRKDAIVLKNNWWSKLRHPSRVPLQMRSPLARPWSAETVFMLKLSEKMVSCHSSRY